MAWFALAGKLPFVLRWRKTPSLEPDPQNYAYDSFGQVPVTMSPNAGGTIFPGIDITAPGMYHQQQTVLVGQPPIYSNVVNQPLGEPPDMPS